MQCFFCITRKFVKTFIKFLTKNAMHLQHLILFKRAYIASKIYYISTQYPIHVEFKMLCLLCSNQRLNTLKFVRQILNIT